MGTMRVGICEDNEGVRNLLKLLLEEYEKQTSRALEIRCYQNGLDALQDSERHDILLTNVIKPQIDGRLLGQEINRRNKRVQIIYVTGCAEDALANLNLPQYRYVRKPFLIKDLYAAITAAIDTYAMR